MAYFRCLATTVALSIGATAFAENYAPRDYIGNIWMSHCGLNWYDNTARMHDPILMHFASADPLYIKYPDFSPWSHCAANPVNVIDPNGYKIEGISEDDIDFLFQQVKSVLSDDKFVPLLNGLHISGKRLVIDKKSDISSIISNTTMTADESCFVGLLVDAINTKESIKVEYFWDNKILSSAGQCILLDAMKDNPTMYEYFSLHGVKGQVAVALWKGGVTTRKGNGAYALIHGNSETVTINTFHEILGHGMSLILECGIDENNRNAVRVDNLVRRLTNQSKWDGSGHQGNIIDPYILPTFK